ncbi:MAG TPA: 50S ribosomal protein L9 [Candidatus Acidoferrales bacterium]|jgi:large subunit ribosomal protein L9
MDVILEQDVEKLGTRGQVVVVADGYARNYLFPRKLAVPATPANRKRLEQLRSVMVRQEAKEKSDAELLAKQLTGLSLTLVRKAGETDQLFGSVTAMDVAEALATKGFQVDKRKIILDDPIKVLGEFDIPLRLHREVSVNIHLHLKREE